MRSMAAPVVPRRAHPAGEQGADAEEPCVDGWRADQGALEAHAAGDGEEREEQDDEGDVLADDGVERLEGGRLPAVDQGAGNEEGEAPEDRNFAEVVLPEVGDEQGAEGDGKQHAGEGDGPDDGELLAWQMVARGHGLLGEQQHARQDGKQGQAAKEPDFHWDFAS